MEIYWQLLSFSIFARVCVDRLFTQSNDQCVKHTSVGARKGGRCWPYADDILVQQVSLHYYEDGASYRLTHAIVEVRKLGRTGMNACGTYNDDDDATAVVPPRMLIIADDLLLDCHNWTFLCEGRTRAAGGRCGALQGVVSPQIV
eukprot:5303991-Pyramimonas_sp.AAC.1